MCKHTYSVFDCDHRLRTSIEFCMEAADDLDSCLAAGGDPRLHLDQNLECYVAERAPSPSPPPVAPPRAGDPDWIDPSFVLEPAPKVAWWRELDERALQKLVREAWTIQPAPKVPWWRAQRAEQQQTHQQQVGWVQQVLGRAWAVAPTAQRRRASSQASGSTKKGRT